MAFRIRPPVDATNREDLKPKTGDEVVYEGQRYVVSVVGMRYLHMHRKDDPRKSDYMTHIQNVVKVPKQKQETNDVNSQTP